MRLLACTALSLLFSSPAMSQSSGPAWGSYGIETGSADRTVKPGDDFWSHVNGSWAKTAEIPADQDSFSQVLRLNKLAAAQVRAILDEMQARRGALNAEERRAVDYYAALMDQATIDATGAAPLLADLAPIRTAADRRVLATEMGKAARLWMATPSVGRMPRYFPSIFEVGIGQDAKEPTRYTASVGQSGLGMPNRDYYLKEDADSLKVQSAYRDHVARLLSLSGASAADAPSRAAAVHEFEKRVAAAHWGVVQSRDADKTYNPRTLAQLKAEAPGFDWEAYLGAAGLAQRPMIIRQSSAISLIAKLWSETPLPVLQDWLAVRLAKDRAMALPKPFQDAEFAFSGGVLSGATDAPARWSQSTELTGAALTDAVSKPYIERHFSPATKRAMDELVANVIAAMDQRLSNLSWMAPETKVKARAKLAAFTPMIGYPDTWRSYEGMRVERNDAYGNLKRAGAFHWDRRLARIDEPVVRKEWSMMPITANAYASFANNQIVFPAAFLQAPYFDPHADPAVNYGSIGSVIGHEISHHFDDQGSKFDTQGRLATWWTPADVAAFDARKAKLVAQYDAYEVLPGLNIRGAQTLGENIADNAGLAIAYDAYHYFGRLRIEGGTRGVLQCGQRVGGGLAKMLRIACRMAGIVGCGGGPETLFFPSRCGEAAGLEESVGDHRHQGVSV